MPVAQPEPNECAPQQDQEPVYRGYEAHLDSAPHERGVNLSHHLDSLGRSRDSDDRTEDSEDERVPSPEKYAVDPAPRVGA